MVTRWDKERVYDEAWARSEVCRRLRVDGLRDSTWGAAVAKDRNFLHMIRHEDEESREVAVAELKVAVEELIDEARAVVGAAGGGSPRPRIAPAHEPAQVRLPDQSQMLDLHEQERARAFSLVLAGEAERARNYPDPMARVPKFRDEWLGGRTLAPEAAVSFLRSPAVAMLTADQFREHHVPVLAHTAKGETTHPGTIEDGALCIEFAVKVNPPDRVFTGNVTMPPNTDWNRSLLALEMPASRGGPITYWPRSLLEDVCRVGGWLAGRFPWAEPDAVWFVLTGEVPKVEALTGTVEITHAPDWVRGTISLTMDAWVSPETVEKAYRRERGRSVSSRRRPKVGFSLWLYCEEEIRRAGRPLSDRELWRRWKAAHPEETRYANDHSPFSRELKLGRRYAESIGLAPLPPAKNEPSPPTFRAADFDAIDWDADDVAGD